MLQWKALEERMLLRAEYKEGLAVSGQALDFKRFLISLYPKTGVGIFLLCTMKALGIVFSLQDKCGKNQGQSWATKIVYHITHAELALQNHFRILVCLF